MHIPCSKQEARTFQVRPIRIAAYSKLLKGTFCETLLHDCYLSFQNIFISANLLCKTTGENVGSTFPGAKRPEHERASDDSSST